MKRRPRGPLRIASTFISAVLAISGLFRLEAAAGSAQETLTVAGRISNGTAGGSVPSEMVVTAVQLDPEGNEVERRQASSDPDGSFRFDGFAEDRGRSFVVGTDYLGVTYSRLVEIPAESVQGPADLTIFEVTEDDSVLRISSDVTTVAKGPDDTFEVIQLLRLENSSDRTFIGRNGEQGRAVLRLPVPQGAFDFLPLGGITPRGLGTEPGAVTTADPVLPGDKEVAYLYKARISGNVWVFVRSIFYRTDRADVLVDNEVTVEAPGLTFEEEVPLNDRTYRRYRAGPLEPGEILELNMAVAQAAPGGLFFWGLLAGLLLVILAGLVSVLARRKRREASRAAERKRTIEEIADLDERFEAGTLPEAEYVATRGRLKERLESLTDELATQPSPPD